MVCTVKASDKTQVCVKTLKEGLKFPICGKVGTRDCSGCVYDHVVVTKVKGKWVRLPSFALSSMLFPPLIPYYVTGGHKSPKTTYIGGLIVEFLGHNKDTDVGDAFTCVQQS